MGTTEAKRDNEMAKRACTEQREVSQRLNSRCPRSVGEGEEEPMKDTEEAVLSWKPGEQGVSKRN